MSALEQEIMAKFYQLDKEAQKRVRMMIEQTLDEENSISSEPFDYEAWMERVKAIREKIREDNGGVFPNIDAIGLLREIRNGEDE
jgi:hypothetical protein